MDGSLGEHGGADADAELSSTVVDFNMNDANINSNNQC